ncbi:MAG TPA: hypothetical protein VGL50_02555 [Steroidobacteraceae bacterium]|jgi:hypothetical protein
MEHAALPVEAWSNFYVIAGSSAGGLTGLTFVVIALVADAHAVRMTGLRAFITPTIIHFSSALLLSALLNVPGQSRLSAAICLGAIGLWGVLYTANTALHVRRLNSDYTADAGDWSWNVLLPLVCYAALLLAGLIMSLHTVLALYITAAVTVLLLFTGIHNAWDIAVWFTAERPGARNDPNKQSPPSEPPAK